MAASAQQQEAVGSPPTPQLVGNAFVQQYYHILRSSPEHVYRFYQDSSKLGRAEDSGNMGSVSTLEDINEKILSLDYGDLKFEIKTVDSQDSHDGAVLVLVTGYLTGKDNVKRNFTQTFFLARQDKGYFVLNDMFRYVEDSNQEENQDLAVEVEAPITPDHDSTVVQEVHVPEQMAASSEEAIEEEVYDPPPENGEVLDVEEEQPVAEVVDEIPDDSQLVTDSDSKIEDTPKKSYASIVKVMKESSAPLTTIASAPVRPVPKEKQSTIITPPVTSPPKASAANSNYSENGNSQEDEADGYSIYIRGLPMNATVSLLEAEFKKFGPIKTNGIQVRSNKGFCFGFVEFEVQSAVQSAIEASPVTVGGCQAFAEEKRSRGNRGRYATGRSGGGFRNEVVRGRGNFGGGGRGYNRTDFNARPEFGNRGGGGGGRGGYQNRGTDGFQRAADQAGSNGGGRSSRAGGTSVNATAKSVAQRVSVPA